MSFDKFEIGKLYKLRHPYTEYVPRQEMTEKIYLMIGFEHPINAIFDDLKQVVLLFNGSTINVYCTERFTFDEVSPLEE